MAVRIATLEDRAALALGRISDDQFHSLQKSIDPVTIEHIDSARKVCKLVDEFRQDPNKRVYNALNDGIYNDCYLNLLSNRFLESLLPSLKEHLQHNHVFALRILELTAANGNDAAAETAARLGTYNLGNHLHAANIAGIAFVDAAKKGFFEVIDNFNFSIQSWELQAAIRAAVREGHLRVVLSLIDKPFPKPIHDELVNDAFIVAATDGHVNIVKALKDHPDLTSKNRRLAFTNAAAYNKSEIINLLKDHPDIPASEKNNVFILALGPHDSNTILVLKDHPDITSESINNCLIEAAYLGHLDIVKALKDRHDITDVAKNVLFVRAAAHGWVELIEELKGTAITLESRKEALAIAIRLNLLDVIKVLKGHDLRSPESRRAPKRLISEIE